MQGARQLLFVLLLLWAQPLRSSDKKPLPRPDVHVVNSFDGRIVVVGRETSHSLTAAADLREVAQRTEKLMGLPLPNRETWKLRLMIGPDERTATASIKRHTPVMARQLAQTITIANLQYATSEDVLEELCAMYLQAYLFERIEEKKVSAPVPEAPRWLAIGLAQNLYPKLRDRNARTILSAWSKGKVPSLRSIIHMELNDTDQVNIRASTGMAFKWLSSLPESAQILNTTLCRLAESSSIDAKWLAEQITGQPDPSNLEELWDKWLSKQRDVVYQPGTLPASSLELLRASLAFYPGYFGIPMNTDLPRNIEMNDLIVLRKSEWIPSFATSHSTRLRLIAAGRSDQFTLVVNNYITFFDALARKKRAGTLKKLERQANASLLQLEQQLEPAPYSLEPVQ